MTGLAIAFLLLWGGCHSAEVCDWIDNDGDGVIDEGFDEDGDGWWACGVTQSFYDAGLYDCDDADPQINPDASEACDGMDNNCDGLVDPGCDLLQAEIPAESKYANLMDWDGDGWLDVLFFSRVDEPQVLDPDTNEHTHHIVTVLRNQGADAQDARLKTSDSYVDPADCWNDTGTSAVPRGATTVPGYLACVGRNLVFLKKGDGILEVDAQFSLWGENAKVYPERHRFADVDGDGVQDIVSAGADSTSDTKEQVLWTIQGDVETEWRVTHEVTLQYSSEVTALHVADVDGDGRPDVVLSQYSRVLWFRGVGDGSLVLSGIQDLDGEIKSLVVADYDGDGRAEAVASVPSYWRIWYLDDSGGVPLATTTEIEVYRNPYYVASGDIDGDGDADLVVSDEDAPTLTVMKNDGTGSFSAACQYATISEPDSIDILNLDAPPGEGHSADMLLMNLENRTLQAIMNPCTGDEGGTTQ